MKTPALYLLGLMLFVALPAAAETKILVLGDSLTAGYGVTQDQAFPAQLEAELKRRGYPVDVINSGISGDTSAGGAARLAWSLSDQPDMVIVELGANDALRGLSPLQTEAHLAEILGRLKEQGITVLLTGMRAPRNLGEDYYNSFDSLYPRLAKHFNVAFYPFFLEGVVGKPAFNQADGIHPNAAGVQVIVKAMLPLIETLL